MTEPTREEALAHFGVKGMRWGVTTKSKSVGREPTRRDANNKIFGVSSRANDLIRESRRASSPAARQKIAKQYEKDVLNEIKSPEFKAAYEKASTMSKGEMATHALILGPLALVSIPATRSMYKSMKTTGYETEIDVAHDILREMRSK